MSEADSLENWPETHDMAQLVRDDNGIWHLEGATPEEEASEHGQTQQRYMTAIDPLFTRAKATSEFDFLHSLIPVFSLQEPGWDPYETTIGAVLSTLELIKDTDAFAKARHLQLWLWGHILEASAPYELLARLSAVCGGRRPKATHFPDSDRGLPQSPGKKIDALQREAEGLGMGGAIVPLREIWDGDLRNAVFHADYTLYGGAVRIPRIGREYSHEEIERVVVRAICVHRALEALRTLGVGSYEEPTMISAPAGGFAPGEQAVVIVRRAYGAVGMKDAYTTAQLAQGGIPFRLGIFNEQERAMLDADPELAILPER
jgi:hypothetical protein